MMALLLTLTACGSSSSELLDTSTTGDFVLPFSGKTVKNDDTGKKNHNNDDDYDDDDDYDYYDSEDDTFTGDIPVKPDVYVDETICENCDGTGEVDCGYCNGTGILYGSARCSCGNGRTKCIFCFGQGGSTDYYIESDLEEDGYKKIDPDYYDSIWNIYVGARYSALDIPFETYYDYIYNQVLLNQLNIMQGHCERIVLCLIS